MKNCIHVRFGCALRFFFTPLAIDCCCFFASVYALFGGFLAPLRKTFPTQQGPEHIHYVWVTGCVTGFWGPCLPPKNGADPPVCPTLESRNRTPETKNGSTQNELYDDSDEIVQAFACLPAWVYASVALRFGLLLPKGIRLKASVNDITTRNRALIYAVVLLLGTRAISHGV